MNLGRSHIAGAQSRSPSDASSRPQYDDGDLSSLYLLNTRNGRFGKSNVRAQQVHFEPAMRALTAEGPKRYVSRERIPLAHMRATRSEAYRLDERRDMFEAIVSSRRSSRDFS